MVCPICTTETDQPHTDDQCTTALIESGLFHQTPWFNQAVPAHGEWTDQEHQFAKKLALQAVEWKKTELRQRKTTP